MVMLPVDGIHNQTSWESFTVDECKFPTAVQPGYDNLFATGVWYVQFAFFWENSQAKDISTCRQHNMEYGIT